MSVIPKSLPAKLVQRVQHWDDERSAGNSIIVSLKDGWMFPATECHTQGFDNIKEAITGMRESAPCTCLECIETLTPNKRRD